MKHAALLSLSLLSFSLLALASGCGDAPLVAGAEPDDLALRRLPPSTQEHGSRGATFELRSGRSGEVFVQLRTLDVEPRDGWAKQVTPTDKHAPDFRVTQGRKGGPMPKTIDSTLRFRLVDLGHAPTGPDDKVLLTIDPVTADGGKVDHYAAAVTLYGTRIRQPEWAHHGIEATAVTQIARWQDHAVVAPGTRASLGYQAHLPPIDGQLMKADLNAFPIQITMPDTVDDAPAQVTVVEIGWIPDAR
ncbi:MAG: hypothetical protein KAI24_21475 [Planctomycetes bacterium]|nr:hypothetical protein [Planctomycetota bacterium]